MLRKLEGYSWVEKTYIAAKFFDKSVETIPSFV